MECIIRELELLLLDPCNDLNDSRIDKIKQTSENNVIDKVNKIIDLILSVKNVDLYSSLILLEELFGKPVLINCNITLWDKSNYFNYINDSFTSFLENSNDFIDFQLNSFVLLCTIVLCINVVVRANWIGPKFSLQNSQKTLSDHFRHHITQQENGNTCANSDGFGEKTSISRQNIELIKNLDVNNSEKCYLLGKLYEDLCGKVVLKSPELTLTDSDLDEKSKEFLKQLLNEFVIDGETVYEGTLALQYLYTSIILLHLLDEYIYKNEKAHGNSVNSSAKDTSKVDILKSKEIWRNRIGYIYQLIIEDSGLILCPTLYHCSITNFLHFLTLSQVMDEEFSVFNIDVTNTDVSYVKNVLMRNVDVGMEFDDYFKSLLLIELLQRLPIYNLNRLYEPVSQKLTNYLNFSFEFTGKLGIRRKFQSFSIPQLVISYSKPFSTHSSTVSNSLQSNKSVENSEIDKSLGNSEINGKLEDKISVGLNEINEENDIFETPRLDEDENSEDLNDLEQLFLLSRGLNIIATTSQHDQLSLQFLNTISSTIIQRIFNIN
eukprot:XP_765942.1 hypothetical protein [Theileria parva strain Muguga]